ncbi:hypothetical protein QCA50_007428 [Cerrena zonata]|uniref:Uncharacterized protein n=1 Tax=Cerrena zonata TaxID=2478898 RepID=A0AAW0GKL0_9APHY
MSMGYLNLPDTTPDFYSTSSIALYPSVSRELSYHPVTEGVNVRTERFTLILPHLRSHELSFKVMVMNSFCDPTAIYTSHISIGLHLIGLIYCQIKSTWC